MKFSVSIGDTAGAFKAATRTMERAAQATVKEATDGLKADLRADVEGAGLGSRLATTWRGQTYPKGRSSLSAAGLVFSKAPKIVEAYEEGATITPQSGQWLALPLPGAPKRIGREKPTPENWPDRLGELQFVKRGGGKSPLLVARNQRARKGKRGGFARASKSAIAKGSVASVPMFVLVKRVKVKKRLNVRGVVAKWTGKFPGLFDKNLGLSDE